MSDKFDDMIGDELSKFGFGEKKQESKPKRDGYRPDKDYSWTDDYWDLKRRSMQGTLSRGTKYQPKQRKPNLDKTQFVMMSDECYEAVMNILIEYGIEPIGDNTQFAFTSKMREFLQYNTKIYTEDELYEQTKIG
jgi:hypothetical protein